jgi:amino acid transporter
LLLFLIVGWQFIDPANYVPYIPENTGVKKGQFDGLELQQEQEQCFAFIGFDAVSTASKAKNPKKVCPIGILGSLVMYDSICIVCSRYDRACTLLLCLLMTPNQQQLHLQ